ncbi:VOC family protein [Goodfellowiella coeruleoviolacea]|uniref:VOC domain-containing protein n=1 Tax=Goodfellowiella coeruleoviolacea TaxID=334858 RepID=A0AAE3GII5_9PSEU|nr:VOC family protein [Goodfellowiella coeruleoviolacea]MCP2168841.1 hypothetical protein [Goodfellowiella coeruleoviolacea]
MTEANPREVSTPVPGSPCWVELATENPAVAQDFYRTLFGWEYETRTDGWGRPYTVATLFGDPVAGLRHHWGPVLDWTPYLATGDLAGRAKTAQQHGGTVLESEHVVPGVGTKTLIEDASGATAGLCQPHRDWRFAAGMPGMLVWLEFVIRRATLADRFFGALFDYGQKQFGDGRYVDYMVWYAGEDSVIGRVRMPEDAPANTRPRWIAHFAVDPDVGFDQTLDLARINGGRLRFKPYVSTLGKVAVLADPLGTRFAIIDPSQAADWDYASAADDPYDD